MKKLVFVVLISACATYRFQRVEGELSSIHPSMWQEVQCTGLEVRTFSEPKCQRATKPMLTCPEAGSLKSELSFVQFGAARLREHRLVLTDDNELPKATDPQDILNRNDDATLLSLVLAANRLEDTCSTVKSPRFMMHTGNAVGTGLFSELLQFIAAMDQSNVPWFTAIGPNDVRFLGDMPNESVAGLNVTVPFVPIADGDRFMRFMSEVQGVRNDPSLPAPNMRGSDHGPTTNGCKRTSGSTCAPDQNYPSSRFHGFDRVCDVAPGQLCSQARGYYAFEVPGETVRFKIIVLNTSELMVDDGERNELGMMAEQHRWLQRELVSMSNDTYALVFGHHELTEDLASELINRRVLGYFHGSESSTVGEVKGIKTFGAASILDAPQLAQHIEVLSGRPELSVRVTSFGRSFVAGEDLPDITPPDWNGGACSKTAKSDFSFCSILYKRAQLSHDAARKLK